MHKIIHIVLITAFTLSSVNTSSALAEPTSVFLPQPGVLVSLSPSFTPSVLRGMVINPNNALKFDFLIDPGQGLTSSVEKSREYTKLVKYFLSSLTVPDQDQWVNLSPYEKDRIIPVAFGRSAMGRDLLAQDYLLKQITSSLMFPDGETGKQFWAKVYARAKDMGLSQVPVNTFNKVWIVPDEAVVYEHNQTAYIAKSHLKVMLEEDYLAVCKNSGTGPVPAASRWCSSPALQREPSSGSPVSTSSEVIRQTILPVLEQEVNDGKNFATLRQVFNSMLLATWFKKRLKDSLLGQVYADKSKISHPKEGGAKISPEKIYQQYLQAFKKGVFNFIKEEPDPLTGQNVPKKYFSGGVTHIDPAMVRYETVNVDQNMVKGLDAAQFSLEALSSSTDAAMQVAQGNIEPFKSIDFKERAGSDQNIERLLQYLSATGNKYFRIDQIDVLKAFLSGQKSYIETAMSLRKSQNPMVFETIRKYLMTLWVVMNWQLGSFELHEKMVIIQRLFDENGANNLSRANINSILFKAGMIPQNMKTSISDVESVVIKLMTRMPSSERMEEIQKVLESLPKQKPLSSTLIDEVIYKLSQSEQMEKDLDGYLRFELGEGYGTALKTLQREASLKIPFSSFEIEESKGVLSLMPSDIKAVSDFLQDQRQQYLKLEQDEVAHAQAAQAKERMRLQEAAKMSVPEGPGPLEAARDLRAEIGAAVEETGETQIQLQDNRTLADYIQALDVEPAEEGLKQALISALGERAQEKLSDMEINPQQGLGITIMDEQVKNFADRIAVMLAGLGVKTIHSGIDNGDMRLVDVINELPTDNYMKSRLRNVIGTGLILEKVRNIDPDKIPQPTYYKSRKSERLSNLYSEFIEALKKRKGIVKTENADPSAQVRMMLFSVEGKALLKANDPENILTLQLVRGRKGQYDLYVRMKLAEPVGMKETVFSNVTGIGFYDQRLYVRSNNEHRIWEIDIDPHNAQMVHSTINGTKQLVLSFDELDARKDVPAVVLGQMRIYSPLTAIGYFEGFSQETKDLIEQRGWRDIPIFYFAILSDTFIDVPGSNVRAKSEIRERLKSLGLYFGTPRAKLEQLQQKGINVPELARKMTLKSFLSLFEGNDVKRIYFKPTETVNDLLQKPKVAERIPNMKIYLEYFGLHLDQAMNSIDQAMIHIPAGMLSQYEDLDFKEKAGPDWKINDLIAVLAGTGYKSFGLAQRDVLRAFLSGDKNYIETALILKAINAPKLDFEEIKRYLIILWMTVHVDIYQSDVVVQFEHIKSTVNMLFEPHTDDMALRNNLDTKDTKSFPGQDPIKYIIEKMRYLSTRLLDGQQLWDIQIELGSLPQQKPVTSGLVDELIQKIAQWESVPEDLAGYRHFVFGSGYAEALKILRGFAGQVIPYASFEVNETEGSLSVLSADLRKVKGKSVVLDFLQLQRRKYFDEEKQAAAAALAEQQQHVQDAVVGAVAPAGAGLAAAIESLRDEHLHEPTENLLPQKTLEDYIRQLDVQEQERPLAEALIQALGTKASVKLSELQLEQGLGIQPTDESAQQLKLQEFANRVFISLVGLGYAPKDQVKVDMDMTLGDFIDLLDGSKKLKFNVKADIGDPWVEMKLKDIHEGNPPEPERYWIPSKKKAKEFFLMMMEQLKHVKENSILSILPPKNGPSDEHQFRPRKRISPTVTFKDVIEDSYVRNKIATSHLLNLPVFYMALLSKEQMEFKSWGKKANNEVEAVLYDAGLHFGMRLDELKAEGIDAQQALKEMTVGSFINFTGGRVLERSDFLNWKLGLLLDQKQLVMVKGILTDDHYMRFLDILRLYGVHQNGAVLQDGEYRILFEMADKPLGDYPMDDRQKSLIKSNHWEDIPLIYFSLVSSWDLKMRLKEFFWGPNLYETIQELLQDAGFIPYYSGNYINGLRIDWSSYVNKLKLGQVMALSNINLNDLEKLRKDEGDLLNTTVGDWFKSRNVDDLRPYFVNNNVVNHVHNFEQLLRQFQGKLSPSSEPDSAQRGSDRAMLTKVLEEIGWGIDFKERAADPIMVHKMVNYLQIAAGEQLNSKQLLQIRRFLSGESSYLETMLILRVLSDTKINMDNYRKYLVMSWALASTGLEASQFHDYFKQYSFISNGLDQKKTTLEVWRNLNNVPFLSKEQYMELIDQTRHVYDQTPNPELMTEIEAKLADLMAGEQMTAEVITHVLKVIAGQEEKKSAHGYRVFQIGRHYVDALFELQHALNQEKHLLSFEVSRNGDLEVLPENLAEVTEWLQNKKDRMLQEAGKALAESAEAETAKDEKLAEPLEPPKVEEATSVDGYSEDMTLSEFIRHLSVEPDQVSLRDRLADRIRFGSSAGVRLSDIDEPLHFNMGERFVSEEEKQMFTDAMRLLAGLKGGKAHADMLDPLMPISDVVIMDEFTGNKLRLSRLSKISLVHLAVLGRDLLGKAHKGWGKKTLDGIDAVLARAGLTLDMDLLELKEKGIDVRSLMEQMTVEDFMSLSGAGNGSNIRNLPTSVSNDVMGNFLKNHSRNQIIAMLEEYGHDELKFFAALEKYGHGPARLNFALYPIMRFMAGRDLAAKRLEGFHLSNVPAIHFAITPQINLFKTVGDRHQVIKDINEVLMDKGLRIGMGAQALQVLGFDINVLRSQLSIGDVLMLSGMTTAMYDGFERRVPEFLKMPLMTWLSKSTARELGKLYLNSPADNVLLDAVLDLLVQYGIDLDREYPDGASVEKRDIDQRTEPLSEAVVVKPEDSVLLLSGIEPLGNSSQDNGIKGVPLFHFALLGKYGVGEMYRKWKGKNLNEITGLLSTAGLSWGMSLESLKAKGIDAKAWLGQQSMLDLFKLSGNSTAKIRSPEKYLITLDEFLKENDSWKTHKMFREDQIIVARLNKLLKIYGITNSRRDDVYWQLYSYMARFPETAERLSQFSLSRVPMMHFAVIPSVDMFKGLPGREKMIQDIGLVLKEHGLHLDMNADELKGYGVLSMVRDLTLGPLMMLSGMREDAFEQLYHDNKVISGVSVGEILSRETFMDFKRNFTGTIDEEVLKTMQRILEHYGIRPDQVYEGANAWEMEMKAGDVQGHAAGQNPIAVLTPIGDAASYDDMLKSKLYDYQLINLPLFHFALIPKDMLINSHFGWGITTANSIETVLTNAGLKFGMSLDQLRAKGIDAQALVKELKLFQFLGFSGTVISPSEYNIKLGDFLKNHTSNEIKEMFGQDIHTVTWLFRFLERYDLAPKDSVSASAGSSKEQKIISALTPIEDVDEFQDGVLKKLSIYDVKRIPIIHFAFRSRESLMDMEYWGMTTVDAIEQALSKVDLHFGMSLQEIRNKTGLDLHELIREFTVGQVMKFSGIYKYSQQDIFKKNLGEVLDEGELDSIWIHLEKYYKRGQQFYNFLTLLRAYGYGLDGKPLPANALPISVTLGERTISGAVKSFNIIREYHLSNIPLVHFALVDREKLFESLRFKDDRTLVRHEIEHELFKSGFDKYEDFMSVKRKGIDVKLMVEALSIGDLFMLSGMGPEEYDRILEGKTINLWETLGERIKSGKGFEEFSGSGLYENIVSNLKRYGINPDGMPIPTYNPNDNTALYPIGKIIGPDENTFNRLKRYHIEDIPVFHFALMSKGMLMDMHEGWGERTIDGIQHALAQAGLHFGMTLDELHAKGIDAQALIKDMTISDLMGMAGILPDEYTVNRSKERTLAEFLTSQSWLNFETTLSMFRNQDIFQKVYRFLRMYRINPDGSSIPAEQALVNRDLMVKPIKESMGHMADILDELTRKHLNNIPLIYFAMFSFEKMLRLDIRYKMEGDLKAALQEQGLYFNMDLDELRNLGVDAEPLLKRLTISDLLALSGMPTTELNEVVSNQGNALKLTLGDWLRHKKVKGLKAFFSKGELNAKFKNLKDTLSKFGISDAAMAGSDEWKPLDVNVNLITKIVDKGKLMSQMTESEIRSLGILSMYKNLPEAGRDHYIRIGISSLKYLANQKPFEDYAGGRTKDENQARNMRIQWAKEAVEEFEVLNQGDQIKQDNGHKDFPYTTEVTGRRAPTSMDTAREGNYGKELPKDQAMRGGIDLTHADMLIKRDSSGAPLEIAKQDLDQLSRITGFEPHLIEIRPASSLQVFQPIIN